MFKTLKWEDWFGATLGAWLFISPWVLGYSHNAAVMNALVVGSMLVILELLNLGAHEYAEEFLDVVAGSWLMFSPLALGFADVMPAAVNALVVGMLVALFAIFALSPYDRLIGEWWRERRG